MFHLNICIFKLISALNFPTKFQHFQFIILNLMYFLSYIQYYQNTQASSTRQKRKQLRKWPNRTINKIFCFLVETVELENFNRNQQNILFCPFMFRISCIFVQYTLEYSCSQQEIKTNFAN